VGEQIDRYFYICGGNSYNLDRNSRAIKTNEQEYKENNTLLFVIKNIDRVK
jgi:hypothetical protein